MAQTETKVLTAHIPLPLAKKIDQMACRMDRSRAWIVKQALAAWVATEEGRAGETALDSAINRSSSNSPEQES